MQSWWNCCSLGDWVFLYFAGMYGARSVWQVFTVSPAFSHVIFIILSARDDHINDKTVLENPVNFTPYWASVPIKMWLTAKAVCSSLAAISCEHLHSPHPAGTKILCDNQKYRTRSLELLLLVSLRISWKPHTEEIQRKDFFYKQKMRVKCLA